MDQYTRPVPSPAGAWASAAAVVSAAGATVVSAAAAAAMVSAVPDPPPHAVREPTMAAANANAIHFLFFIKYVLLESYCVFADSHSLPIIQL